MALRSGIPAALLFLTALSLADVGPAQIAENDVVPGWRRATPMSEAERRPCRRSAAAAASASAAFHLGDYARAIETSAEALACPDQFELGRHFELWILRAESLHREWRGRRSRGMESSSAQLVDAAAAVDSAFALLRGEEPVSRQNSVYRRAEDEAMYLVNELYNAGVLAQQAGNITHAASSLEGAIRMFALAPKDRIKRDQEVALAQAAYLTGMDLQAQGETQRSLFCLRAAVPLSRELLAAGPDALRAAIAIPQDQALPAYYSLGVLLYNRFVNAYNRLAEGGELGAGRRDQLDAIAEEADLSLRLGLLLAPERRELQSVLAQVGQARQLLR